MLIGYLKLPNKWALTAAVENKPFVYRNCPPMITYANSWGNVIKIDPWFNNYKLISQDAYNVTEYWCVNLSDGVHDNLLVPILMKRFGCGAFTSNSFLLKNGIFDLLVETNRSLPDFNLAYIQQYGVTEVLLECLSGGSGLFQSAEKFFHQINTSGGFEIRFNSGTPFLVDELLRRCVKIDPFAKNTMAYLNEIGDLTDIGIYGGKDLIHHFLENLPVNMLTYKVDVDWIGECILLQNVTNFTFEHLANSCIKTTNSQNLMNILKDVSVREELINIPNYTTTPIVNYYAETNFNDYSLERHDNAYNDIVDDIDTLCTAFILDEATTVALEFDIRTGKLDIIDRVYGYGLASAELFTHKSHANNVYDIEFTLRSILESMNAWKIRCIKTYNEELFITITYNGGEEKSYYINLIAHACVSGCLFSA